MLIFMYRYLKRESEPKDRELWSGDKPNLHQATYKMIGKNIESDVSLNAS